MRFPIIAGPTASGKTSFALKMARRHGLEIINADSLLVYRGFDVGTAKPSRPERAEIPHHLIDIRDPMDSYTAADFVADVRELTSQLEASGVRALIVGGTHFYLKALCLGLWEAPPTQPNFRASQESRGLGELFAELAAKDPSYAQKIGPADRYRIIRALEILEFSNQKPSDLAAHADKREPDSRFPLLWIDRTAEDLEDRIALRTREMLDQGLIDETRRLLEDHPGARALESVGYRQGVDHLQGRSPEGRSLRPGREGLEDEIRLATRQLVKSQRTFLRGFAFAERFLFEGDRHKLEARVQELLS